MLTASQSLRVIPYGTGTVGTEIITTIIDHRPDLQIVGARVYSDAKNGADIGTLVGRDAIGVAATTDVEKILGLQADCVLYTPRNASIDEVCAILASGKNVVTTAFLFGLFRKRFRGCFGRFSNALTGEIELVPPNS